MGKVRGKCVGVYESVLRCEGRCREVLGEVWKNVLGR